MSDEAEEIVDAIQAARRERLGLLPFSEALKAAPQTERGRWLLAEDSETQYAANFHGGLSVWWRREFASPEWQPYEETVLPRVLWMPIDPANLPPGVTLPEP